MPSPHKSAKEIFLEAAELTDPSSRARCLSAACGDNAELRRHVEALLRAHDEPDAVLDQERIPAAVILDRAAGPPTIDQQLERPGTQIGPYKLLEQIGEGGMGTVFVAQQSEPIKRLVALKIIKPGMDSRQVIARFEAERQALALMDHPNIAKVLDAGTTDSGRPFFVMELVKGVPLTQYCDSKRLTPKERLELFLPVCQAVQHAHQKGIIHRDLKPSNVLVALYDGRPVPKVIDFGVAKATGGQLTEKTLVTGFGSLVGTLEYMSPEQAELNQLDVDTRSDIYSLGVLLYELLTGTTPFDRQRLRTAAFTEILRIIREEEPPLPSTRLSTSGSLAAVAANRQIEPARLPRLIRGEIDWIVMKALEKDRNRRYETANALAADVSRCLGDERVEACPPSLVYAISKLARRHKAPLAVAAGFVVLLLAGAAVSAWQAVRARNAETLAVANERKALESAEAAQRAKDAEAEQRRLAEESEQTAVRERNSTLAAKEELRESLYASEMNLVQAAVESRQYARAAQLLRQQRPTPGQADLRGFEWHYWQRQLQRGRLRSLEIPQLAATGRATATSQRPGGPPRIFSRDGTRLVALHYPSESGSPANFGLITIFDCSTGREVVPPFDPFPGEQAVDGRRLLVTISDDGTRLAAALHRRVGDGRSPGYISIRDGRTGSEIRRLESPGIITEMALTADGSRLAVEYRVPEPLPSRREAKRLAQRSPEEIAADRLQVMSRQQAAFKIWDASTGELIQTLPKLPSFSWFHRILWSPDGTRLLRQSVTMEVIDDQERFRERFQVVEAATGEIVWQREFAPHATPRRAWAWSPDGKLLVVFEVAERGIAARHNAQLWDSATGKTLAVLDRESPSDGTLPDNIDFSPDGRLLAVASAASEIYVWEVPELPLTDETAPLHIAAPHLTLPTVHEGIQALAFSADGRELHGVAGSSIVTWDATVRESTGLGPDSLDSYFISAISVDATKFAFCAGSLGPTTNCVWDLTSNREVLRIQTGGAVARPAFSAAGRRVALVRTGDGKSEIVIFDTQTGEALSAFSVAQNGLSPGVSFHDPAIRPDGGQIAALISSFRPTLLPGQESDPPRLVAWDTATGKQAFSVPIEATFAAGLVYSPDGSSLVVGTSSQGEMAAVFYDAATGERQKTVAMPASSRTAVLILPSHQIFSNFVGPDALFLDLQTGRERFRLSGHHDLEDAAISPDGSRLAAGRPLSSVGGESEITLWNLKNGQRLLALKRQGNLESIAFSPDGSRLVATFLQTVPGEAKPIQVWDATPLPDESGK